MSVCQDHWTKLREAVFNLGMNSLISEGGEEAAVKMASELTEGLTIDNFDPLMYAFWNLQGNASEILKKAGGDPLYIMIDGPEDIVRGYGILYDGKKWPRCAICYLSLAHEMSCSDLRCTLPKKTGYEWMINKAAESALQTWKKLGNQ